MLKLNNLCSRCCRAGSCAEYLRRSKGNAVTGSLAPLQPRRNQQKAPQLHSSASRTHRMNTKQTSLFSIRFYDLMKIYQLELSGLKEGVLMTPADVTKLANTETLSWQQKFLINGCIFYVSPSLKIRHHLHSFYPNIQHLLILNSLLNKNNLSMHAYTCLNKLLNRSH